MNATPPIFCRCTGYGAHSRGPLVPGHLDIPRSARPFGKGRVCPPRFSLFSPSSEFTLQCLFALLQEATRIIRNNKNSRLLSGQGFGGLGGDSPPATSLLLPAIKGKLNILWAEQGRGRTGSRFGGPWTRTRKRIASHNLRIVACQVGSPWGVFTHGNMRAQHYEVTRPSPPVRAAAWLTDIQAAPPPEKPTRSISRFPVKRITRSLAPSLKTRTQTATAACRMRHIFPRTVTRIYWVSAWAYITKAHTSLVVTPRRVIKEFQPHWFFLSLFASLTPSLPLPTPSPPLSELTRISNGPQVETVWRKCQRWSQSVLPIPFFLLRFPLSL